MAGSNPAVPTSGADLRIDGVQITRIRRSRIDVRTESVNDDVFLTRFAFTGLHEAMTDHDITTAPDVEHTIFLNAANFYAGNEALWADDSAEARPGSIFNHDKPLALKGFDTRIDVRDPSG